MKLLHEEFHPCCGFHLQGIIRWIPYLDFLMMVVGMVMLVFSGFIAKWDEWNGDRIWNPTRYYTRTVIWVGYSIHMIITSILALVLWKANTLLNPRLLRVWMAITPFSVLFAFSVMTFNMLTLTKFNPSNFSLIVGYILLKLYLCYVVYTRAKELDSQIEIDSDKRGLTDMELQEFEEGFAQEPLNLNLGKHSAKMSNYSSAEDAYIDFKDKLGSEGMKLIQRIQHERYKREDFEIEMKALDLDLASPLGFGEFGIVYKARMEKGQKSESNFVGCDAVFVAVKTVNPDSTDINSFKALLSELKVMTYLGKHDNVIELIGANTTDIKLRRMHIVIEFCALGCLKTFLTGHRGTFVNQVIDGRFIPKVKTFKRTDDYVELSEAVDSISTTDLLIWADQVALGMDFLKSRKVIHGDLAARNVLLTDRKVVKITDFGLARQLYNYMSYVKSQKTGLPWRWLALESLTDMVFSSSSDVWAYGVTLWEIFSLAQVPYQKHPFCLEFVQQLKKGLRPGLLANAPAKVNGLMTGCWDADVKQRPEFSNISQDLKDIITSALEKTTVSSRETTV